MKLFDAEGSEIDLGDEVIAGRASYMYRAWIYRVDPYKVLLSSTDPKKERPNFAGYSFSQQIRTGKDNSTIARKFYTLMKP